MANIRFLIRNIVLMSLLKQLAGDTVVYGLGSVLPRILNFVILTPYYTNTFATGRVRGGVRNVYLRSIANGYISPTGWRPPFFRFGSEEGRDVQNFFNGDNFAVRFQRAYWLALLLFNAQGIANWLEYPDQQHYVKLYSRLSLHLMRWRLFLLPVLRLENKAKRFALIKVLNIVITMIFVFFFLEVCPRLAANDIAWAQWLYDPEDRIQYVFIANLLGSTSHTINVTPIVYAKMRICMGWDNYGDVWYIYAAPLIVVGLAAVVNQLINIPLIRYLLPFDPEKNKAMMGVFSGAAKIAVIMSLFTQAFNYAAEPFFFKNAKRGDAKQVYAEVGQLFALVASVVFLGIMLYIDIVQYYIGKDFREGLQVVPILLLAYLCLGLYYNFSIWYKLNDRTSFGAYISVGGAIITLAFNFLLIPRIGYVGAAWAALACYAFMAGAGYLTGQRFYPIPYPMLRIIGYILFAVIFYQINLFFRDTFALGLLSRLLLNTALLFVYLGVLFFLDKEMLLQLVRKSK